MRSEHHFGTRIVWRTIPIGFPVFRVAVPERSGNAYRTSPNLCAQKKFTKLRQNTQITWLCPADFFGKFFSYYPFDVFRNLWRCFLSHFWIKRVLWPTVPCIFRCFTRNCLYYPLIPRSCHNTEGKVLSAEKTELRFIFITKVLISSSYEGKVSTKTKQVMTSVQGTIPKC